MGSNATGHARSRNSTLAINPALNLDADACGDLNAGTYTNVTFTIPNVLCQDYQWRRLPEPAELHELAQQSGYGLQCGWQSF